MQLEDALRLEIQCLMNEKDVLRAELAAAKKELRMIEACVENDDCGELPLVRRVANTVSSLVTVLNAHNAARARADKAEAENAALKAHVERLREALECIPVDLINAIEYGEKLRLFLSTDSCKLIGTAIAATPEQSLAKLRAEALRAAANLIHQTTPIPASLDPYERGKYDGRMYAIKQLEEEANNEK